jgi:hypothetical protein
MSPSTQFNRRKLLSSIAGAALIGVVGEKVDAKETHNYLQNKYINYDNEYIAQKLINNEEELLNHLVNEGLISSPSIQIDEIGGCSGGINSTRLFTSLDPSGKGYMVKYQVNRRAKNGDVLMISINPGRNNSHPKAIVKPGVSTELSDDIVPISVHRAVPNNSTNNKEVKKDNTYINKPI